VGVWHALCSIDSISKVVLKVYRGEMMSTATIKTKTQGLGKPSARNGKASAPKRRGQTAKKSPWTPIAVFLIFAGLVAYMFSPNVPDSQRSGSDSTVSGFAKGLSK